MNGDDLSLFVGSSGPSAVSGYPDLTVPAGYVGPLPIGVSFIGDPMGRAELIGYAYAFEQASQVRVPPSFLPSIDATAPGHGNHGHHATDPADLGRRSVLMPLR